ncbi:hypothetical protein D3C72_1809570 [compost metagenome]
MERRRMAFSTMTTEPSTIRPKSMAPRLMRLAERPSQFMPMKAKSMERGMVAATSKAALTFRRKMKRTATTSNPPSRRLVSTVRMVLWTRSV